MKILHHKCWIVIVEYRKEAGDKGPSLSLQMYTTNEAHRVPSWQTVWRADLFDDHPHTHFFGHKDGQLTSMFNAGTNPEPSLAEKIELTLLLLDEPSAILASAGIEDDIESLPSIRPLFDEIKTALQEAVT